MSYGWHLQQRHDYDWTPEMGDDWMVTARRLLRRQKIRVDADAAGELGALKANPNWRKSFFSQRGLTWDSLGEAIYDARIVPVRPEHMDEVLVLLERAMATPRKRPASISARIFALMNDGKPYTRTEIRRTLGLSPDVDIASAIRRLRKAPFERTVTKERVRGKIAYRLV